MTDRNAWCVRCRKAIVEGEVYVEVYTPYRHHDGSLRYPSGGSFARDKFSHLDCPQ